MDSNLTTTAVATTVAIDQYPTNYHIYWGYTCDIWMPLYLAIVVLYAFELWILWTTKNPKYKSCYFTIFIVTGIADVIDAVAIEYIRFSQRVGMGPSFGWLLQITTAITGSNYTMHLVGNTLMSIFQFTAIWFPMTHNSFWKKKTCFILMTLMIVVSIGVYGHLLFTEFIFIQDSIGRWRYKTRKDPITKTRILDSILQVSQSIVSGVTSGAVIVGIRMKTEASFKKNIPEKSLVLVEIINVIFGSMETLYGLISLFNIPLTNPVLDFIYNEFVSYFFFMVCLNAITLPLLSKTMRQEMLWWKRNAINATSERSTTSKVSTIRTHHK